MKRGLKNSIRGFLLINAGISVAGGRTKNEGDILNLDQTHFDRVPDIGDADFIEGSAGIRRRNMVCSR